MYTCIFIFNFRFFPQSLLNGLVSKRNLADIARKLIEHAHAAEPAPSDDGTDGNLFFFKK